MDVQRTIAQEDKPAIQASEVGLQKHQREVATSEKVFTPTDFDTVEIAENKWMNRAVEAKSIKKLSTGEKNVKEQNNAHVISLLFEVRENGKEAFKADQLIIRKNLWFLDGSRELHGEALLNAKEYREDI